MRKIGFRLWLLIIFLVLALLAISPSFKSGVIIKSVERNSTAFDEGLRQGLIIKEVNGNAINTVEDYTNAISKTFSIPGEFEKTVIRTEEQEFILFTDKPPAITVGKIPRTSIKTGLDLSGGARALVKPANISASSSEISDLIAVTNERFNVYGLSDITLRPVRDLEGNNFMLVEIAGATPSDLRELVGKQGKFEAKIGEETVFVGGEKDITNVCRTDAACSGIFKCNQISSEQWACNFRFTITLSPEAADHYAEVTKNIPVNSSDPQFLSEKLDFYLDDVLERSLLISKDLKGSNAPEHSIEGSGIGNTRDEAIEDANQRMHKLQTILITGSLPYKLEIVKLDTISPLLGQKFINYLFLAGTASLMAVAIIVFLRYKKIKPSLAILLTSFSEIIIILGIASLIKWNLDLASIAGILIVIGTGVDQQIIIIDESRTGEHLGIVEKIKKALFIIIGAYFTSLAALIPIYWAGAGLLRGFAVTTIIGITTGVLITRPAFAEILRRIESD